MIRVNRWGAVRINLGFVSIASQTHNSLMTIWLGKFGIQFSIMELYDFCLFSIYILSPSITKEYEMMAVYPLTDKNKYPVPLLTFTILEEL